MKHIKTLLDIGALLQQIEDSAENIIDVYPHNTLAWKMADGIRAYSTQLASRKAFQEVCNRRD